VLQRASHGETKCGSDSSNAAANGAAGHPAFQPEKLRDLHFGVLIALTPRAHGAKLITSNCADFELIRKCRHFKIGSVVTAVVLPSKRSLDGAPIECERILPERILSLQKHEGRPFKDGLRC